MTIRQWHLTRGGHVDGGPACWWRTGRRPGPGPGGWRPGGWRAGGRAGRVARRLGVVGLALVLISAMDSIRNLPTTATFGWSAIFFYGIAVLTYLVPVALCSAELATTVGGGMYRWVREAFGSRWGFLAVWCDWSENIVWFPTVLVFLATTAAYVINPNLSQNKAFLVPVMLVIFWAVTLSSLFGSLKSARWTGVGVIIGTAIPTAAIIVLGLWWTASGNHSEIPFHATAIIPAWNGLASLVYAAGIVVAFAGMEIGGFFSHVTRNIKRTYPGAVLIAAVTVATLSILGSVAIAMVVPASRSSWPRDHAGRVGLLRQARHLLPDQAVRRAGHHRRAVRPGVLEHGPGRGHAPGRRRRPPHPWWGRTNRRGAPTMVLLLQATLGSVLSLALIFVNNINTYYWMLTALVAQTFLIMYFLMYIAVIRLRITQPEAPRPFKIPGGKIGLALIVGAGIIGAAFTFFLGFIPATHLSTPGTIAYVAVMALGMITIVGTPFLLHRGPATKTDTQTDPGLGTPDTPPGPRHAPEHAVARPPAEGHPWRGAAGAVPGGGCRAGGGLGHCGCGRRRRARCDPAPAGRQRFPDAASFTGISQVGALFQGAWQSNPHFCSASVVDSPSGDVIATAAHCLSGNGQDLEFVPMYHDGQVRTGPGT